MSYLKIMCKRHHEGLDKWRVIQIDPITHKKKYWIPELQCFMTKLDLELSLFDGTIDPFDIAYLEYEKEMERINNLSKRKRKRALKKRRKEISCLDCCNETIYDGYCCRYGFEEYPTKGYECCCHNREV